LLSARDVVAEVNLVPRAIGFRAKANEVYFAIVEGASAAPVVVEAQRLRPPKAYELPQALGWLREAVLLIVREHEVSACAVRTTEPLAALKGKGGKGTELRHYVEGVLLEATASTGLRGIYGPSNVLIACLDAGASIKGYVEAPDFRGVEDWEKYKSDSKEAIIAAASALRLLEEK
jgi:hypothetical protein